MRTINLYWVLLVVLLNVLLYICASGWWLILTIPVSVCIIKETCIYHWFNPLHTVLPNRIVYNSIISKFDHSIINFHFPDESLETAVCQSFSAPYRLLTKKNKFRYFLFLDIIKIYRQECTNKNKENYALLVAIAHYLYADIERREYYNIFESINGSPISPTKLYALYSRNIDNTIKDFDKIIANCNGNGDYFLVDAAKHFTPDYKLPLENIYKYIALVFSSYEKYLSTYEKWIEQVNVEWQKNHNGHSFQVPSWRFFKEWTRMNNPLDSIEFDASINRIDGILLEETQQRTSYDAFQPEDDEVESDNDDEFDSDDEEFDSTSEDVEEFSNPVEFSRTSGSININDILHELDELVGLDGVKEQVRTLINNVIIEGERKRHGLPTTPMSYHMVFEGNPGTGKTTVARIIAKSFKALGLLSKGNLIESHRNDFVAAYSGQTAIKTKKIMNAARGNVLFIDEAYSLIQDQGGSDRFGHEAVDTIIAEMENNRHDMVVILAGYSKEINDFLQANQGFKSRINRFVTFEDYNASALSEIYIRQAKKNGYVLNDTVIKTVKDIMKQVENRKGEDFGNARFVRNLFEKTIEQMNSRLSKQRGSLTKKQLTEITVTDIYDAFQKVTV